MTSEHDDGHFCPDCGRAVRADDRFCLACGTVLGAGETAPANSPYAATRIEPAEGTPATAPLEPGATRMMPASVQPSAPEPEPGATRMMPASVQPSAPEPEPGATRILPANVRPPRPEPAATRMIPPVRGAPVGAVATPVRASVACPRCREALGRDDRFCPRCGYPTPSAARSRKPLLFVGIGALLLALIGGGVVLALPLLYGPGFHTAEYLPADTWLYGTVSTRPGLMQMFNMASVLDAFTSQPGFEDAVRAVTPSSSATSATRGTPTSATPTGSGTQDDLYKLIDGEAAFGISGSSSAYQYVLLLHSSSPDALLRRVMSTSGSVPTQTTLYRGTPVWDDSSGQTHAAVSGSWVVIGYPRRALEQSLDLLSGSTTDNLAKQTNYRNVVNRLPQDKLGLWYVNTDRAMSSTGAGAQLSLLGPDVRNYLAPLSMNAALSAAAVGDGLELRYESIPVSPLARRANANSGDAVSALELLPRDTLVGVSGNSLPAILNDANQTINSALQTTVGVRAPRVQFDVQSWLGGEFALGLTAGDLHLDNQNYQTGQAYGILVAKVKDSGAANRDLQSLDSLINPQTATVSGIPMRRVGPSYQGATAGYYGVSDGWFYLLSGTGDRLLTSRGAPSLQTNARYTSIRDSLSKDGVVLFADGEGVRTAAEGLFRPQDRTDYERKVRPFVQPIRALGGSLKTDDSGDVHGVVKLTIKK